LKTINFLFDVDGTLTPSRGRIDPEFHQWFLDFISQYNVSLVTGSDYDKTLEQLGEQIVQNVDYCFNCAGNAVYQKGLLVHSSEWQLPLSLRQYLEGHLKTSTYPLRFGNHFEQRIGLLNFSVVGRGAQGSQRTDYYHWDLEHHERDFLVDYINQNWMDCQAATGGETGIDIFERGYDKAQVLKYFDQDVYFFGDRQDPQGNDYTLAKVVLDQNCGLCYAVDNWTTTWDILKKLCHDDA
jgi:phosphomannomutase